MATIFEVTPEHIESLTDADLRILVGYIAEQEALKRQLPTSGITFGGHQNAGDGGIDVDVELNGAEIEGFIPRPLTGYQVKAQGMARSEIIKEMRPDGQLRPSILQLGENGGAYIIVSSKENLSKPSLSKRRNAMAEAIADAPAASGLHLDFYDRRRMASWVNQHPGLVAWVRSRVGQAFSGWQPFADWSSSPGPADETYLTDNSVRLIGVRLKSEGGLDIADGIQKLRHILAEPKGAVRLVGLSGVGKTRLVQALFDKKIGEAHLNPQLAVYTDLADQPDPVPLELLGHLHHLGQRCILIVDNCGTELHRKLRARMKNADSLVSLITIEYDISDDEPENTDVFKLEPASGEIIEKIVARRYPNLSVPEIRAIAEFSEGNSRIALALAETAEEGESLANFKDSELFKRLFRQNHEDNPALLRAAKVCSLVYSFDGETLEGDEAELPVLASLAGQSVSELHGHVAELYRRQLVQQRSKWRAVLPHALAHRLAKQALQDIPNRELIKHVTEMAPERLIKSFSKRIGYLHDSDEARQIVGEWLGDDGWLSSGENFNHLRMAVFENIAPVNPEAVLNSIRKVAERDNGFFEESKDHRSHMIGLLRALAYEPEFFDDAVDLIRRFAHEKAESNNSGEAVNVFKSLFYIYLSGTHAPPSQRVKALEKLAHSNDARDQSLMYSGLDAMLECNHFMSSYSFEFGARKRDFGYNPRTRVGIEEWYRETVSFCSRLSKLPGQRERVRKLIAGQFRFLVSCTGLTDELIALADEFAADGGWPEGWAGARSAARSAKKAKLNQDHAKLSALADRLAPKSLAERIASYVTPDQWSMLDVAEIDFDDEKKYAEAQKQVEAKCREIGKELAHDLEALRLHLPAILRAKGNRDGIVAKEIGRQTENIAAAWDVIVSEALSLKRDGQLAVFPSLFAAGVAEHRKDEAEKLLDAALADERLHSFFVHMQAVAGVNETGFERIKKAVQLDTVPTYTFRNLAWGRSLDQLNGVRLRELLLAISEREGGLDVALDILDMRVFSRRTDKQPVVAEEKQAGRELLAKLKFEKDRQDEDHRLAKLVSGCLTASQDEKIAEQLCERLMEGLAEHKIYAWHYSELLGAIAAAFPRAVLDILVEKGRFGYEGGRGIFSMFRDHRPCPLRRLDTDLMLEWAHEKPDTRFLSLAEVIRPWQRAGDNGQEANDSDEKGALSWTPAAMRLMREAPEPLAVLSVFVARFRPSSWGGSLADILNNRLTLLEMLAVDSNPEIAKAANEAVPILKQEIESTRAWEAERHRERDERFEW
jgi:hypothetical protein